MKYFFVAIVFIICIGNLFINNMGKKKLKNALELNDVEAEEKAKKFMLMSSLVSFGGVLIISIIMLIYVLL